jgi:formamidopyrimidine-DNA glycosylase
MPELPDIASYLQALDPLIVGNRLERVRILSPFLLRTISPFPAAIEGQSVTKLRRIGKRIASGFENGLWAVLHLMIAGRLHWRKPGVALKGRQFLCGLDFNTGTLVLTEAGSRRRASLHIVQGEQGLAALDPGGLEVLASSAEEFSARLTSANHTLKRALTDPTLFSGIGNAYSDEILHRARLSPVALTSRLTSEEIHRLWAAARETLALWIEQLSSEARRSFPEKVTAFREGMAVHGRFGQPCPDCGSKVQRIRYAENETNYCARCQTGGRLLADRALSRLLKQDWPRSLDQLEA